LAALTTVACWSASHPRIWSTRALKPSNADGDRQSQCKRFLSHPQNPADKYQRAYYLMVRPSRSVSYGVNTDCQNSLTGWLNARLQCSSSVMVLVGLTRNLSMLSLMSAGCGSLWRCSARHCEPGSIRRGSVVRNGFSCE
jgi:hypothetical protein